LPTLEGSKQVRPGTERLEKWLTGFYIAKQAEGVSPNTLTEYRKGFAHFARWLDPDADPAALSPQQLKGFFAWLRTQPNGRGGSLAPKTVYSNLGDRAGVPKLHPHRLRHTFATEYLRNGGNLLSLQRLLGHSSLGMVKRCASIAESDLARQHEGASPADRWRL
jgi:site-specific recombinase XerD